MITTLKLYAVLNEMQISKIPTVFEYDPEQYQEGSTCTCYRGFEIIQGNGQVERKTVMIKKLKDTSPDSEKRLQEAVRNRLEYAHVFEMARNGIAMDCGLFLDASELASFTSVYSIQQCFDGMILSQIQPRSILYELNVIASAAEILQRLQEKGYIYGDVKEDNLLVKDNSTEVMFFDLNASRKSVQIQQTGVLLTNPFCPDNFDFSERHLQTLDSYMLSALLANRLLTKVDHLTILELVSLWNAKDLKQQLNPKFEDIALISDNVAEKLLAVLKKGMAVCSLDRYSEMHEFRHDLRGVIDIMERIRTTQSVISEGEQKMSKIELTLYPIEDDNNTVFVAKTKVAENFQPAPETPHTTHSTNGAYSQIGELSEESDFLMGQNLRSCSMFSNDEDPAKEPIDNCSSVKSFIKKYENMRIKAKYLYYWKATDDKNRDVPIYIKADGTIYVEGYQTEFNIQDIKKMKYDFDEDEEFAYITLYFGENTDICFSSEYFDDNLYLAINGTFFAGRSETFRHWKTLE